MNLLLYKEKQVYLLEDRKLLNQVSGIKDDMMKPDDIFEKRLIDESIVQQ